MRSYRSIVCRLRQIAATIHTHNTLLLLHLVWSVSFRIVASIATHTDLLFRGIMSCYISSSNNPYAPLLERYFVIKYQYFEILSMSLMADILKHKMTMNTNKLVIPYGGSINYFSHLSQLDGPQITSNIPCI